MSSELKFTPEHEWIRINGESGSVGVTDYAQKQLGDVVYIELPEIGQTFKQGEQFGTIESVKAVSDLYCPASGEVIKVNSDLVNHPETVNDDPLDTWMIILKLTNHNDLETLLDADSYKQLVK